MIYVRTLSRVTFRDIYSYFPCSAWRDLFQDGNKFISFFSHSLSPYLSGFPYYAQRHDPTVQTWNAPSAVEPFSEFMFA